MELRTARLTLRRPRPDDLDAMFGIMSEPRAMQYWSTLPHVSADVTRPWLARMIERNAAGGEDFLIEREGRVIGNVGSGRPPDFGFILHPDAAERTFLLGDNGATVFISGCRAPPDPE